jgi:hypothetical protein
MITLVITSSEINMGDDISARYEAIRISGGLHWA